MSRTPLPLQTEPGFEQRVRDSFGRQPAMTLIGAQLQRVEPGEVEIVLPYRPQITQQHGFVHAGMIGAALDSACGYAALTVMPAGAGILTIEYKLNCLAPGIGDRIRLIGRVRKTGRTILLAEGEALAVAADGGEKLVATMTATVMTIRGRDGVVD
ncbi:MAG TPA: PaaI family thioesterase [Burkholderiaceae bacterium]|nr:PaaI family thioesterase [Burkholderiaceae bacterium]HRA79473.1 PaaI family thioesterase [Burkholderiaceae bacterium]